ncbi:restriction endonuclease subunit S [Gilliamella sp. Pra-s65]|uniref:restriction endonuclease subunit S n=1 Tax=unclassified Gilliamella TaxID=2685620 RepID=UPI00136541E6|nr:MULTISPECIES: restriction endonuclease subunit S [unclassified Gilliamella]MWN90179.1 restriction endonuclease subunit S [Gilliamella sp. Pra-s65]MWP73138.1 restriction endonuclease subunit S [Gilliamella sp. Pra-s52]
MSASKKLIPKRRFKQFSGNWNITTLGKIAEIVRGASPRPIQDQKWFDKKSDIGWLRISDVTEQEGRIYYLEQRLSVAGQEKTRVLYEPHLLLSIAATVGKPVINYIKTGVHDGFLIFLNPKFHREFLFQYLDMFKLQWQKYGQPGSQVNLNSDIVKNHNIELPNSDEQTQIGGFFKKLDNLINTQQKKLEKAKTLKSAYLTEMFPNEGELKPRLRFSGFCEDWTSNKLGNVTIWSKGANLAKDVLNSEDNGHPVIHYADLYKFSPVIDNVIHWSESNEGNIIPTNSLLFPMSDVTPRGLARTTTITKKNVKAGSDTLIATISDEINAEYLSYQINANHKKIFPLVTGTTVKHISANSLSTLFITLTDIIEQDKISTFFNLLEKHINLEQKKLDKLKNIKQAYLNEMFV